MVRNVILKPFVFQQFALSTSISHKVVRRATLVLLQ